MRFLAVTAASLALAGACKEDIPEICDLSTEAPKVKDGKGTAKGDPDDLSEDATWKPGTPGQTTINIGVLTMTIPKEESGSDTDELIDDNAFPICIRLGAQDAKHGAANWVENGAVTDKTHTGNVALLSNDDGFLVGRFEVDMKSPAGEEVSFTDGAFSASVASD